MTAGTAQDAAPVSGRGLEAMFGAPEAHEDDPERALRASFRALASTAAAADGGPAPTSGFAARLGAGLTEEAVTAARRILDPAQQALPDDLTAALNAAAQAWDRGEPDAARQHLDSALRLARDRDYF